MADKRMFTKKITETDAFLDMPLSAQCLYFHLNMNGDDEGFVSSPKRVMRMIGAREDDFKVLLAKRYVLEFDSGVCVVKHWKLHNAIRKDRVKETVYLEEKAQLKEKENGSYTENTIDNQLSTNCQPSIEEYSIEEISIEENISPVVQESMDLIESIEYSLFKFWNSLKITVHGEMNDKQYKKIKKFVKKYSLKNIKIAMERYKEIRDSKHFFNYKWKLEDFLSDKNIMNFSSQEGSMWNNYLDWKKNPSSYKSNGEPKKADWHDEYIQERTAKDEVIKKQDDEHNSNLNLKDVSDMFNNL